MRRLFRLLLLTVILAPPAQAADALRVPPIVGMRACGAGGVVLPGSDSCLRLSGSVVAEASLRASLPASVAAERRSLTRIGATTRVSLDARTQTAMGPMRLYLSLRNRMPVEGPAR